MHRNVTGKYTTGICSEYLEVSELWHVYCKIKVLQQTIKHKHNHTGWCVLILLAWHVVCVEDVKLQTHFWESSIPESSAIWGAGPPACCWWQQGHPNSTEPTAYDPRFGHGPVSQRSFARSHDWFSAELENFGTPKPSGYMQNTPQDDEVWGVFVCIFYIFFNFLSFDKDLTDHQQTWSKDCIPVLDSYLAAALTVWVGQVTFQFSRSQILLRTSYMHLQLCIECARYPQNGTRIT